jgi:hypothetical protein
MMADNTGMYREIKNAIKNQLAEHFNSLGEKIDVYPVPYQNIAVFPAVALELVSRRKPKKGVGVKQLELDLDIWVYVDIMDAEDAEEECLRITEIVEDALEKDKTLGGISHYLSIDSDAEFGIVQQGEASFLQGAKLRVQVTKRFS